jgi:hypothetical protein
MQGEGGVSCPAHAGQPVIPAVIGGWSIWGADASGDDYWIARLKRAMTAENGHELEEAHAQPVAARAAKSTLRRLSLRVL